MTEGAETKENMKNVVGTSCLSRFGSGNPLSVLSLCNLPGHRALSVPAHESPPSRHRVLNLRMSLFFCCSKCDFNGRAIRQDQLFGLSTPQVNFKEDLSRLEIEDARIFLVF